MLRQLENKFIIYRLGLERSSPPLETRIAASRSNRVGAWMKHNDAIYEFSHRDGSEAVYRVRGPEIYIGSTFRLLEERLQDYVNNLELLNVEHLPDGQIAISRKPGWNMDKRSTLGKYLWLYKLVQEHKTIPSQIIYEGYGGKEDAIDRELLYVCQYIQDWYKLLNAVASIGSLQVAIHSLPHKVTRDDLPSLKKAVGEDIYRYV